MAHIGSITIYPIKSLDGVSVERAEIAPHGGLAGDREYAIFDATGRLINGKRAPRVHAIRATYDLAAQTVTLGGDTFTLGDARIDACLSEHFGFAVHVRRGAFPDHTRTPGPSIVSSATLAAAAELFALTPEEMRARFRPNLTIDDTSAFEEDRYIRTATAGVVRCGKVRVHAIEHCGRCVVPSRDPNTGTVIRDFAKRLSHWRETNLPDWTDRATLPHYYHLAILTRVPQTELGKRIAIGDRVRFGSDAPERHTARDRVAALARRVLRVVWR
ncbi:MAG TPA: MOSC N-terminal beta barrel domain-containing protein [Thermoanaerobaculia bacterium]